MTEVAGGIFVVLALVSVVVGCSSFVYWLFRWLLPPVKTERANWLLIAVSVVCAVAILKGIMDIFDWLGFMGTHPPR